MTDVFAAMATRLERYRCAPVSGEIDPCEDMFAPALGGLDHYFAVGRDAVEVLARAMVLGRVTAVRSVLDLPCGGGRVLRHLPAFLPEAELFVGDTDLAKVAAAQRQFGAMAIDAGDFREAPRRRFDLIWSGSLLTHLDETAFRLALGWFTAALEERGLAVVTLHGRRHVARELVRPALPAGRWCSMEAGFARRGFGYAPDYPGAAIGMTLSSPAFVADLVETLPGARLIGYQEAGWVDDQDVLVLQRISGI